MHEVSIAGAIIDAVLDTAKKNNAKKVNEVFLEIGELTALNHEQLKFIFGIITRGTLAEDAIFNIEIVKPLIKCSCSYKGQIQFFEKLHFFLPVIKCPECGCNEVDIIAGRECCIRKIKIS
jgi:hydrogenase nickel incorporation protein HypA/HybF